MEVLQHAHGNLFRGSPLQQNRIGDLGSGKCKTLLGGDTAAAVKRIDVRCEIAVVEFEHKVARQANPENRHMQTSRDLHIHDSQGDRDACPPLQDLVQTTVEGIEKIGLVTVETQFAE